MNKKIVKFWLQPTAGFPDGAPQRENYNSAADHDRAYVLYAEEWRATYRCTGCSDVDCPQCGAQGASAPLAPPLYGLAPPLASHNDIVIGNTAFRAHCRLTDDEIIEVRDALLARGRVASLSVLDQRLLQDCDVALGVVRCAPEDQEQARARILLAGQSTPLDQEAERNP